MTILPTKIYAVNFLIEEDVLEVGNDIPLVDLNKTKLDDNLKAFYSENV